EGEQGCADREQHGEDWSTAIGIARRYTRERASRGHECQFERLTALKSRTRIASLMRPHYLPVVDMRTRCTLLSVPLLLAVVLVGCGKNPVRPEYVTPWSRTSGPGGGSVTCFASDGSTLLAGVADGGVFRSTDAGETWSPVRWAVDDPLVMGLAFSNGKVFAGTWVGGVLRSNNNGDSWIPVNHGLPDQFIYSLGAGNGTVFVDTQFGLYRSTDDGRLWLPVNSTLHARSFLVSGSE